MSRTALFQTAALSAIFLAISGELAVRFRIHAVSSTALYKCCPDGGPEVRVNSGNQDLEQQACLGKGTCKALLSHGDVPEATGFEHCDSDQTEGNHVHEDLPVKGFGALAMPGHGAEGVFEIAIESLYVPTHMI